jgi:translation initiation factor 2 beta subunit (eIF-2beta)/eIF-5
MVHYDPSLRVAQTPPPICPKCGSHRTEIVGRSSAGDVIIVRCHACGERSRLTTAAQAQTAAASAGQ